MKIATELSKHTEDAGPKTSHPNPIHPSAGPQLDVILRTPAGPSHQNLFPKFLDLSIRSHIANLPSPFIETSQDTRPSDKDTSRKLSAVKARHLDKDVGIEVEEAKDTPGARPRSGHISRARTPRGRTSNQGTSQGHGHLRTRALDKGAHL